ncbi:unnamed protein product [Musa hybrid cultivar]
MYAAKTLSRWSLDQPKPGSNSGYIVLKDEESEPESACCFGCPEETRIRNLPFPQDRILTIKYSPLKGENGSNKATVCFIPAVGHPLSSNRYYVIVARGRKRGKVYTCSKEDIACCSCHGGVKDAKLRAFDHRNVYQVMEIKDDGNGKFTAKSVAPDGHPPSLLGREHWKLYASKPKHYALREAWGLDAGLRACLPDLNFPIGAADGPKITVGRWYCPFMFVKEACRLRDQMKRSMFYEISLEQFWQKVYACENHSGHDKVVEVNALFGSLLVMMDGGKEVVQDRTVHGDDGMVWFKPLDSRAKGIGLSLAVWERIKWEQGRGGWIADEEERMVRLEQYEGMNRWKKFACYVLVERFVVKRIDGSLVLTFDFRHSIKVRSKWD